MLLVEFLKLLSTWEDLDTWITVTGGLAAMACALPGTWLLLRRQSLIGDALSHAVLPGIVIAYMVVASLEHNGWLGTPSAASGVGRIAEGMNLAARRQFALFAGAAISAVITAALSEAVQRWGRVERSAALGVIFTSMFALGLLLIRLFADSAHLDPDCVLYGNLEATGLDTLAGTKIPRAALVNGVMVLLNGSLVLLFFKQLRLNTFDPELGASQGLSPAVVSLVLMSITAATIVAAFESVGAILVIAMLIVPGATARLLTDRLGTMIALSLVVAAVGAILGHVLALTVPAMICSRIGLPQVTIASTSGMMAVAAFLCFLLALAFSPRHGLAQAWLDRQRLRLRIAREDLLGGLYRRDERPAAPTSPTAAATMSRSGWVHWLARRHLLHQHLIRVGPTGDLLTEAGTAAAQSLVRSHRLWELYMSRHFALPDDHLHATAEQVEHFLGPELQAELAAELDQPTRDPHGKAIPG